MLLKDSTLIEYAKHTNQPLPFSLSDLRQDLLTGCHGGVPHDLFDSTPFYSLGTIKAWMAELPAIQTPPSLLLVPQNSTKHKTARCKKQRNPQKSEASRRRLTIEELNAQQKLNFDEQPICLTDSHEKTPVINSSDYSEYIAEAVPVRESLTAIFAGENKKAGNSYLDVMPLDIMEMFNIEPQPLDMVLHGLVRGSVGFEFAGGGTGKSTHLQQTAIQVACGFDSLGSGEVPQGKVVILNAEDPVEALHHRAFAFNQHFQLSENQKTELSKNLSIYSLVAKRPDVINPTFIKWIKSISDGARLIIIDTLTRFHGLDENKADDAKRIMEQLEEIAFSVNSSIVLAHHISKSAATSGQGHSQSAGRGSSVFPDNSRYSSYLRKMDNNDLEKINKKSSAELTKEDMKRFLAFNISKHNYCAPRDDLWLERVKGGVLVAADFRSQDSMAEQYAQQSASSYQNSSRVRQKNGAC
jgi:hypothetical protein